MHRLLRFAVVTAALATVAGCNSRSSTGATTTSTLVVIKTAPPSYALVGASVPLAFTVTETLSDGTVRPANGAELTITVTGGGGTINGASSGTVKTSSDGTASFTWVMGQSLAAQTLHAATADHYADVNIPVLPLPIATVEVSLANPNVPLTLDDAATVTLKDSTGKISNDRPVYWQSSNPAVATITSEPTYAYTPIVAVSQGTTVITATSEGKTGSATLTVLPPPPVASVVVLLELYPLRVGILSETARGAAKDAAGNYLTGHVVSSWRSSNPGVATIDSTGHIEPISPGTSVISATIDGLTGSATVTVTP